MIILNALRDYAFCALGMVLLFFCGCASLAPESHRAQVYAPRGAIQPPYRATSKSGQQYAVGHQTVGTPAVGKKNDVVAPGSVSASRGTAGSGTEALEAKCGRVAESHTTLRRLKSGDHVTITLRGIPHETDIQDVIDGWGEVTLPYIGEVKIVDLTVSQAERRIERLYIDGGIYRRINVIVVAEDQVYFVQGEVARQGKFELSGKVTLMQAISEAGGFTPFAKKSAINVIRGDKISVYDYNDISSGKSEDPVILADDILKVPRRRFW